MYYNGVYTAIVESSVASGAGPLIELQVPSNTQIEIIRAWVGAAEGDNPVDEIQEVYLYGNDAAATGGAAMTELALQGGNDATSAVTALSGPAQGATPTTMHRDGFHTQIGWLYLPYPDERIRIAGAGTIDNIGMGFPIAPDASITISAGITWGELG